ncbi:VWA containing CoxE family protein [Anaeromyxobacter dehalogenans 2CP-1]|uniref:VWA containing CoxE family protein n=1 Tax=Anaeromyxobacter dehalogenans (strain ATCC BAA-258 / DSM 21875 / 2CP-1) TaxID=455488 RepID=B8J597_ANAD2|nr:VWA domain-containing protein [Anaeromyxobacter dehalogenans]ACL64952.1 VWA containing CoxE family protein [Anaeromyxobacter dehalogenans 2CP-1]
MDALVSELARLLRANGVRVSPAEVADAVAAGALVGVEDRGSFKAALRATLVKRAADVPVFEALFDLLFSGMGRLVAGAERGLLAELEEQGLLEPDDLEMVAWTLGELASAMSPLALAALQGDPALLARLLRAAAQQLDFAALASAGATGFQGRRLLAAAGGAALPADAAALEQALRARGLDAAKLQLVSERVAGVLRRVEDAARRWAELEAGARSVRRAEQGRGGLAPISRDEIARTERAVKRLAERLKSRLVRRDRSRRRGVLAVRRTLRRNLGLGGFPAQVVFRRRRPQRPDVVVLCDVSESVRHVTRLMLLFLYTMQSLFSRVRTFVFVADLAEVTAQLRAEREPARAADLAVAARAVSLAANSNYGRALRTFHRDALPAVTRRTTVLVIGDGRNNYNPPEAWVLEELRRRARRVLWMCPEPRHLWGTGDSELPLYAAHCDRVAPVTTLAELEGIADALVPAR